MDVKNAINEILDELDEGQLDLIHEVARAIQRGIRSYVNPKSDLLVPDFVGDFSMRLIIHHVTHSDKFKKKAFEYVFCAASRSANRVASIVSAQTNPGADVIVDDVKFSLKTEAARDIRANSITISKLMEARWIRDCRTREDFCRETTKRVVAHLQQYQRILTLRAFDEDETSVRYDFVEIPLSLLLEIRNLTPGDFGERTKGGGSSAAVKVDGTRVFTIRLDGSVEKVTISGLLTSLCFLHGSWTIG